MDDSTCDLGPGARASSTATKCRYGIGQVSSMRSKGEVSMVMWRIPHRDAALDRRLLALRFDDPVADGGHHLLLDASVSVRVQRRAGITGGLVFSAAHDQ